MSLSISSSPGIFLTTILQNSAILKEEGKSQILIRTLLEDGQKWANYRVCLRDHLSESKKLQKRFETDPAFFHEVLEHERRGQTKQSAQPKEDQEMAPRAILQLKNLIDVMEKECKEKISELETRTNKMIEMVSVRRLSPYTFDPQSLAYGIRHHAGVQPRFDP